MNKRPSRHGVALKHVIEHVKAHGRITTRDVRDALGWTAKKAYNRLSAWATLGWLTYKGEATFEAGPKMVGERLLPKEGSDEFILLEQMRAHGSLDMEDAEMAIDDVPRRAKRAMDNLMSGGWVKSTGAGRFVIARDPFISEAVRARVNRIVEEIRSGQRKFN